jgi:DNA-binding GntR family transcriptional regulator
LHVPSLVDAVYAAIREKILNGQLTGGSALTELDLAAQYSVARPTAKSAMERLVHDGLLRRATNKTARVPVLDSDDIRDLYFSRAFLEREVAVTLAGRRFVPEEALQTIQRLRDAASKSAVTEVVAVDVAFHRALFNAIGSPRLDRLFQSLMGEVHLCMAQVQAHHLLSPDLIADEHMAILDAIQAGARRRASDEITNHLSRACTSLIAHLEGTDVADE